MGLATRGDLDCVAEEGQDGGQALGGSAKAAGEVDDEGGVAEAGDAAGEPGVRVGLSAESAHGLGDAGGFAVEDAAGGLWGSIAGTQASAADGKDKGRALESQVNKGGGDLVLVVGEQAGPDLCERPGLAEQGGDGGAGGVGKQALGATVGDGKDGEEHWRDCRCPEIADEGKVADRAFPQGQYPR